MKKISLILLIIGFTSVLFIGCTDEDSDSLGQIVLQNTDYLGCFLKNQKSKDIPKDTLYYEFQNSNLVLNLSIVRNCADCLTDTVEVKNDSVKVYITDACPPVMNCICQYDYKYYFTEYGDKVNFCVFVKSYDETEFTLWDEINYP